MQPSVLRFASSRSFLALLILFASASASLISAQETAFGGIELASTSVKGLTFVFQPGAEAKGTGASRPERMKRLQYAERNANFVSMRDGCKLSAKGLDLLVKDTSEVLEELREGAKEKDLGNLQLYGVASSGLGLVCNKEEILAKVQAATGLCMEFISASDEAKYNLGFALPRDRYHSLILNFSGANINAGYYVTTKGANWPPREWHGLELEYGARTLKDKALALMKTPRTDAQDKATPAMDFYTAVDQVLEKEVGPKLDDLKAENSALTNFSSVYLVGGVVWATSTRARPVQQQEWAINSLTIADFDTVLADLKEGSFNSYSGAEFGPKTSRKTRDGAEQELNDVLQRFDTQSLYAGISLARFVLTETNPRAQLYFPTTAAWISGYAREKFRETGRAVTSCPVPVTRQKAEAAMQ